MSPILVRPVREQLEHDRVIRLLQQDLAKKKVDVGINPGAEQNASVGGAGRKEFPDAVLYSTEKGKKLIGVVEVETAESVNHLEAMSQWALLAKLRVPFHLYVPTGSADAARRLSDDHRISVTEIWSYHQVGEQFKFTLIYPPARGRSAATAPRLVSVASIRVEPRVDPTAAESHDEPAARSVPQVKSALPGKSLPVGRSAPSAATIAGEPKSPRVIPARPKGIPSKAAVAAPVAKPASSKPSPAKSSPAAAVKAAPTAAKTPAKAAPTPKVAAAKVAPAKAASGKVVAARTAPAKVVAAKAVTSAARATRRAPATRPPAAPRKPAPVRKPAARPPAAARVSKSKRPSARKPAPKRR